jgi:hypothetical protein
MLLHVEGTLELGAPLANGHMGGGINQVVCCRS